MASRIMLTFDDGQKAMFTTPYAMRNAIRDDAD